jgi:hypothetical protein
MQKKLVLDYRQGDDNKLEKCNYSKLLKSFFIEGKVNLIIEV